MAVKPLNPRQQGVLAWIADGCPDGVMTDSTYKNSAMALRNRHLVKITRRGGWHAELTQQGRDYLERGPRSQNAAVSTSSARQPAPVRKSPAIRNRPTAEYSAASTPSAREAPEPGPTTSANVEEPAVPERVPRKVAVPSQLRAVHPAVAVLRDDKDRLGITSLARNRALRILQGLAVAAEREGYSVKAVRQTRNAYGYMTWDSKNHLVINTGEIAIGARILQESDRSPHEPTAEELDRQKRWGSSPPKYDHKPNDRLRVEIDSRWDGRRHVWRDGARGSLEGKLPALLDEVAERHVNAAERRRIEEQEQAERERRRRVAIERAKVLLRESNRAQVLSRQAAQWQEARGLREYVEAMEQVIEGMSESQAKEDAAEWLCWARKYSSIVDPLRRVLSMPDDPEPTYEALRPFL